MTSNRFNLIDKYTIGSNKDYPLSSLSLESCEELLYLIKHIGPVKLITHTRVLNIESHLFKDFINIINLWITKKDIKTESIYEDILRILLEEDNSAKNIEMYNIFLYLKTIDSKTTPLYFKLWEVLFMKNLSSNKIQLTDILQHFALYILPEVHNHTNHSNMSPFNFSLIYSRFADKFINLTNQCDENDIDLINGFIGLTYVFSINSNNTLSNASIGLTDLLSDEMDFYSIIYTYVLTEEVLEEVFTTEDNEKTRRIELFFNCLFLTLKNSCSVNSIIANVFVKKLIVFATKERLSYLHSYVFALGHFLWKYLTNQVTIWGNIQTSTFDTSLELSDVIPSDTGDSSNDITVLEDGAPNHYCLYELLLLSNHSCLRIAQAYSNFLRGQKFIVDLTKNTSKMGMFDFDTIYNGEKNFLNRKRKTGESLALFCPLK